MECSIGALDLTEKFRWQRIAVQFDAGLQGRPAALGSLGHRAIVEHVTKGTVGLEFEHGPHLHLARLVGADEIVGGPWGRGGSQKERGEPGDHSIPTPAGPGLEWRRTPCQFPSVFTQTSVNRTRL